MTFTKDGVSYTDEEWWNKKEAEVGQLCVEHNKVIKKGKYGNWCGGKDQFGRWCEGVVKK